MRWARRASTTRTLGIGIGGLVAVMAFVASCSAAREAIGISAQPITFGSVVDFAGGGGQETSACWTQ